jgi:protein-tyrosine-phosphatase
MAEGLMRTLVPEEFRSRIQVASAGTLGINGSPATEFAIVAASRYGADIRSHRSQGITPELVKEADIILGMTTDHLRHVQSLYPGVRENTFLLKTFGRDKSRRLEVNIPDPIGRSLEVYEECCYEIHSEIKRILPRLIQMVEDR